MPNHNHDHRDHSHCDSEAHNHVHDHPDELELAGNLFAQVDLPNVTALNITDGTPGSRIIKPWHERQDETVYIESDADDQIIIRIPFTSNVTLRSILLKCGPGDQTPDKVYLYANEDSMDFSDISDKTPAQDFHIPQSRDIGEYAVKAAKFSNLSSLTLFFAASQGAANTRIYFIALKGTFIERKRDPVITVYETRPNLADHEKIQGTDGSMFTQF